jgi:hypothetical protein
MLLLLIVGNKNYEVGMAYNGIMLIPNFVKTGQIVSKLGRRETYRTVVP